MSRKLASGFVAACALFGGSAGACEWHEMMAYGYGDGAPQRYSAFSRAEQHAEPAPPPAPADDASAQTAEAQTEPTQDGDAAMAERDRSDANGSEREETVLAARR